jgi:excisionase family DNA binding protein
VLNNLISVKEATKYSGYSSQYLRRLLRAGQLTGLKIGQVWFVEMDAFEEYLEIGSQTTDRRFGPK